MSTLLFVRLSSEENKRNFKTKCAEEGYDMREVVVKAIDEFLKNGKESCFIK